MVSEFRIPDRMIRGIDFNNGLSTPFLRPPSIRILAEKMIVFIGVNDEGNL